MSSFMQTLNDPHARHAMLVHAPIALGILTVIPMLALACSRFRSKALIGVCAGAFVLTSVGAALAANAGEAAMDRVLERGTTGVERAAMDEHEELAEIAWVWPIIPAGLLGGVALFYKRGPVRIASGTLATAASIGVAVWIGLTAHAGGRLVYVHGLGVPPRAEKRTDTPAPPASSTPKQTHDDDHSGRGER